MNRLRNQKQTYLNLVKLYAKQNALSPQEAQGFEQMFRNCRSQEEQRQVFEAMMNAVRRLIEGTDRYAHLHRDDILGEE